MVGDTAQLQSICLTWVSSPAREREENICIARCGGAQHQNPSLLEAEAEEPGIPRSLVSPEGLTVTKILTYRS